MAKRPTASELVDKIREARGNVSAIARAYNTPRTTVYGWIDSYETTKQELADQRQLVVDVAESVLFRKVVAGELNAVFYTLNNMAEARGRGWGKKEVDITSGGEKLSITLEWGDNAEPDR